MGWALGTDDGMRLGDSDGIDVGRAVGQIETLGCIDGCHNAVIVSAIASAVTKRKRQEGSKLLLTCDVGTADADG